MPQRTSQTATRSSLGKTRVAGASALLITALTLGACSTGNSTSPNSAASASSTTSEQAASQSPTAESSPSSQQSASATATASSSEEPASSGASATPSAATAVKSLVAGFPSKLLPLMPKAEIQSSSLQNTTPLSVASLIATTSAKPAEILDYYTKSLTSQGFKAQPGSSVEGVPLKTFVRAQGQEVVTVSVIQTGSTSTLTLGANVLPGSLK